MRLRDLLTVVALSLSSPSCTEDEIVLPPPAPIVAQDSGVMDFTDKLDEQEANRDLESEIMDFSDLASDYSDTVPEFTKVKLRLAGKGRSAVRRMQSVCSTKNQSLEDGFVRLILITPYWTSEAMHDGAVYVRGGRTNDGRCSNRAQPDFADRYLKRFIDDYERPAECKSLRNRGCTEKLQKMYQERVVDHLSGRYLCADCTTFVMQLFDCAFGKTIPYRTQPTTAPIIAASPGVIKEYRRDTRKGGDRAIFNRWTDRLGKQHWGSRETPDMGTCWDMIDEQLGGLQFGDIIQFPGHFALYTGGIGLDYEMIEMGAYAFSGTEIHDARISLRFNKQRLYGIRVIPNAQEALSGPHVRRGCVVRRVASIPSMFDYTERR